MQISYQNTLVTGVKRAITVTISDDAVPPNQLAISNAALAVANDATSGQPTAVVQALDQLGNYLSDVAGPVSASAQGATEAEAITAAATAIASRLIQPPTISALSPSSGPAAGGTTVVITGYGFLGTTAVAFGGVAAASFTIDSATQITAITPAGTAGAADVAVTAPGGTGTQAGSFTFG